ncbi:MAG TPA: hypothetical protein VE975_06985, partial [Actinomycetota bacterium]|nr:hypothetical protein [Actinomycetota bacterium]
MIAVDLRWPPGPRRSCGARRLAPPERPIPEKPPEKQSGRRDWRLAGPGLSAHRRARWRGACPGRG